MQPKSRAFLLGTVLNVSILIVLAVQSPALSQATGHTESSSASSSQGKEKYGPHYTPPYYPGKGDMFESQANESDSFADSSDTSRWCVSNSLIDEQTLKTLAEALTYRRSDFSGANVSDTFEFDEQLDPQVFTWSDDPRDVFASPPSSSLQKYPLYKGTNSRFTFISVSDGPQLQSLPLKIFAAPAPKAVPKWNNWNLVKLPEYEPVSTETYRNGFGQYTRLFGWPVNRSPVRVYFAGNVGEVRDGLVKRVFVDCMREWCTATKGRLKFMVVDDWKKADITLCRELTVNHELAENNPSFNNAWLDHVKIRLLDCTCDNVEEKKLRAVLLHSAGHALGFFRHTMDRNSALYEQCAEGANPTQHICPCDTENIRKMYESYKRCFDDRFQKRMIAPPVRSSLIKPAQRVSATKNQRV
ncbi:MAG: hypothetical protein K2Y39_11180 [Candidatus Obscuribacterales bacterium]|nr:hypothetical protein [Candidatus Obscuribacterales bacterium]